MTIVIILYTNTMYTFKSETQNNCCIIYIYFFFTFRVKFELVLGGDLVTDSFYPLTLSSASVFYNFFDIQILNFEFTRW